MIAERSLTSVFISQNSCKIEVILSHSTITSTITLRRLPRSKFATNWHAFMNSRFVVTVCAVLCSVGCNDNYEYHSYDLAGDAENLRVMVEYWSSHGRPPIRNIEDYYGKNENFFLFTNTVSWSNEVFHCCFAVRRPNYSGGFLAISDQGIVMWIRERDTNITISPEKHGVKK